ncbi:hypothetical protein M089_5728 [Bacteroides ovatus str. 3725 D9 iii]|nr:hypothetical protein M082_5814 [Bacteroides fragilis str. 3725 D9 ii]KDS15633.1 hypothetical protein M089_5728 [Bacteroides ovatus str. 3725 D9 iii]KDS19833.1 hypothetical protein M088_6080 [Bacteroides ovatus str. 3725 D1 iv]
MKNEIYLNLFFIRFKRLYNHKDRNNKGHTTYVDQPTINFNGWGLQTEVAL